MQRLGRQVASTAKKVIGSSSRRSHGSASTHHAEEYVLSPMLVNDIPQLPPPHEQQAEQQDEEQDAEEEEEDEPMDTSNDPLFLDLEGDREIQAYNLIKLRKFVHTPAYDPELLERTGMSIDFPKVFNAVGWENVLPIWENGSRLLTIQFLCSLQIVEHGITFHFYEREYYLS